MNHARKDKKITDYNTFQVFGNAYQEDNKANFGELQMPENRKKRSSLWFWLSLLLFITILGGTLHPILSYALKTPYPLVLIGEDSMHPSFKKNDLVIVTGIIDKASIMPSDIIVYLSGYGENELLTINRVTEKDSGTVIVKGDAIYSESKIIKEDQIVGKLASSMPIRLPLIGAIGGLINK
jgi:signal peptidase I